MPLYNKYENIGIAKRLREAVKTQKENAFSIFVNNTKTHSAMTDTIEEMDGEMFNFHTFWKGEENAKSIREARGISHCKIDCIVLLYPLNFSLALNNN
jgi:hypothetical protein